MLQARRSEKDFLARENLKYVARVRSSVDQIIAEANKIKQIEVRESIGKSKSGFRISAWIWSVKSIFHRVFSYFRGHTLAKINGSGFVANLPFADLEGFDLRGSSFEGANLMRANLQGIKIEGVNFSVEGSNFRKAFSSKEGIQRAPSKRVTRNS